MPFLKKKIVKNFVFSLFFFVIFILGFWVRILDLGKNPAGFFCDEASIGYNAYLILKTGRDEWGVKFPIFFRAFGEYKNPLDIYFTIPFISLFGLNEFSVRFTSFFFGVLNLFLFFLIGKLIKDKFFGLVLMLFVAINPWHIHLSRINLEGFQIFIFFLLLSIYFIIKYFKNKKFINLVLFSIFCAITTYSYFPARVIIPIFYIANLFLLKNYETKKIKILGISILIYIFISLPIIFHLFFSNGLSRWYQVSLFNQNTFDPVKKFIVSYFLHFSPDFLFLKGDIDMTGQFITRHSIRGLGQFYLWQAPFIILGIYYLIVKKPKFYTTFFLLLLLYPIPSSLTVDISPQATRSLMGIIPFNFLTAFGFDYLIGYLSRKVIKKFFLLLALFLIITFYFLNFLYLLNRYPLYSSDFWGWQYGPREIMKFFLKNRNNYDELFMSGEFNAGEIFLKFYDPENLCFNKCKVGDLWRNPEIYNYQKRQLFSLSPQYLKNSKFKNKFKIKKIIYYPNGKEAFYIGEVISQK